jgi:hypothetical protein
MVELVYTQHLKCCPYGDAGSTPALSTIKRKHFYAFFLFLPRWVGCKL